MEDQIFEDLGDKRSGFFMPLAARVALLTNILPFSRAPATAVEELAALMQEEEFPADSSVVVEGEHGDKMYVIVSGKAEATTRHGRVILARMGPRTIFGELALLVPNSKRQATVKAVQPLKTLSLSASAFEEFLHSYPPAERVFTSARRTKLAAKFLRMHVLYRMSFENPRRERMFLASVAFLICFAVVRFITASIRSGRGPFRNITQGDRHIHHLVWGILLLLGVGYSWLAGMGIGADKGRRWMRSTAIFFGIGAALTLDEFALWLNLEDVYWTEEGRTSIDAVLMFGSLLSVGIWGEPFWELLFQFLAPRRSRAVLP